MSNEPGGPARVEAPTAATVSGRAVDAGGRFAAGSGWRQATRHDARRHGRHDDRLSS